MKLYNTLTRKKETLPSPEEQKTLTLYACGPTVYDYQHIGNLRTAVLMDTLKRALRYLGYDVHAVMNITDIEDKIENRAKETGRSVDEIIKQYETIYLGHLNKLNISADVYPHATDHVKEQIAIIHELENRGYAYMTPHGLYFDISKDDDYGKLGNTFRSDKAVSRIEETDFKRNPEDFVLWRSYKEGERQKIWDSPWGEGAPGWHIECSAMSMKTLTKAFDGDTFDPKKFSTIDIHIGGADLKETHHENEIAQSESATDKQFVKYWVHGGMLEVSDDAQSSVKMSKSLGNFLTLEEVKQRGFDPLALRYFYHTAHYRKPQTFSWEALAAAQAALRRYPSYVHTMDVSQLSQEQKKYDEQFRSYISEDLNMPKALALAWDVQKSDLSEEEKTELLSRWNSVFGLEKEDREIEIPDEIRRLAEERQQARKEGDFQKADKLRDQIQEKGYSIKDVADGYEVSK